MMHRDIFLCTVRVYRSEDRVLDDSGRAIVVTTTPADAGEAVVFDSNGKVFRGEIIDCVRICKNNPLYRTIRHLNGYDVRIHLCPLV